MVTHPITSENPQFLDFNSRSKLVFQPGGKKPLLRAVFFLQLHARTYLFGSDFRPAEFFWESYVNVVKTLVWFLTLNGSDEQEKETPFVFPAQTGLAGQLFHDVAKLGCGGRLPQSGNKWKKLKVFGPGGISQKMGQNFKN